MINLFKSKWSKWQDLECGQVAGTVYLLQFRRHNNGKVMFRVAKSQTFYGSVLEILSKLKGEKR